MQMSGAQALVRELLLQKVDTVFGLPGAAVIDIYDELRKSGIRHVLVRHEAAAVHAASGYARSTGKVGVCIATSGPGATNMVTGIANAYLDSTPLVVLTGQVHTSLIGSDAFQEADITGATSPFCKHNLLIRNAADIPRIMAEAFYIASTGRPGPVLLDIPCDVAQAQADMQRPEILSLPGYKPARAGNELQLKRLVQAMNEAERPLILAGGGVISSQACEELRQLAQASGTPVSCTMMGIGALPGEHPLSLGMLGIHGTTMASQAAREADFILTLGARLGERAVQPGLISSSAILAHIDIDPAEIGKTRRTNIPVVGDIKLTLQRLLTRELTFRERPWISRISHSIKPLEPGTAIEPLGLMQQVSLALMEHPHIVTTDVGQHQLWAARRLRINQPRSFLASCGLGVMGYGLPAAIGASLGSGRPALVITGDGSFQMHIAELATAKETGADLHILLLNNHELGLVREIQTATGLEEYAVSLPGNPDFVKLCGAWDIPARRISTMGELPEALSELTAAPGIRLLEVVLPPGQTYM